MGLLAYLLPAALVALLLVVLLAWRSPILATMAWRNALRRSRHTMMVIAGLLVGTAIVSSALVSGDSMRHSIVQVTYDSFLETDETVFLDGYYFFPQGVEKTLRDDPQLRTVTDAVGSNILWDAAVTDQRSLQYEPGMRLVGFDPTADRAFGAFRNGQERFTGETLGSDEVVLDEAAAQTLDARVGDTLTLNFTRPVDPLLPRFQDFAGRVNLSAGDPLLAPLGGHVQALPWETRFTVEKTTVRLGVVLNWNPGSADPNAAAPPQDLDLQLLSPSNHAYTNAGGTLTEPDVPAVVNVTGSLARPLEAGAWRLRVMAKAAAQTPFNGTTIQLAPVYELQKFEARVRELQQEFPDFDPGRLPEFQRYDATVRVAFIADGGKGPDFKLPTAYNLFLRMDRLQELLNRTGEVNFVKISNRGGPEEGPDSAPMVYPLAWERLNATKAQFPDHPAVQSLRVGNDKVFWLEQARRVGQLFTIFLTFIGSFSVIAGLLLIINIFTMLAEERKTELGISRAVGMRRRHLTRLFVLEGALYAFPAAVLGTMAGLGLAALLIWGFNAFGDQAIFPAIPYRVEVDSLLLAFSTGTLLTLGTVYVGARRISRLNVVCAIRNLEEPERVRGSRALWSAATLVAVGVAGIWAAFALPSFTWQVLGPTSLALGAALLLRRRFPRRTVYPAIAVALFLYLATMLFVVKRYETIEGNIVGPLRGVLLTLSIVVVLVYNETAARAIGRLLSRLRPVRAVATVAVSYPLHKKFRTGMTLAMFSVILLMVSLFSIFGALFQPDPEKEAGGYEVQATTTAGLASLEEVGRDPTLLDRALHIDTLPYFLQIGGTLVKVENQTTGQFGPPQDTLFGVNAAFADHNTFHLLRRDAAYATDADAYRALVDHDDLVIVAYTYSTDESGNDDQHQVGDDLTIEARGGLKHLRIIGIQEQVHFKGIFIGQTPLHTLFSDTNTLFLFDLPPAEDPDAYARDLEAHYRDVGLDAASIRSLVLEESQQFRQIFTLIQLFLSLGLIVGILSLGIVTARNIIERRQEIGMMRALGLLRRDVRRAFLVETLTVVTLGVLIGAATAILVSFGLWFAIVSTLNIPYAIPWRDLIVIAIIAYVATTLSTLGPIVRASRIPPAEALRYIE